MVSSLKPIEVAIARIEGENAIQTDVQTLLADVREEICTALPTSLLLQAEETAVLKYIKKSEDICLKPIHAPAYMLDPKYAGKSILSGAEIHKAWMRARFLAVWQSTLPSKGFGMEMQHGSRANISHQLPGGMDFVDLRLFPVASIILQIPPTSAAFFSLTTSHPQQDWKVVVFDGFCDCT